MIAFVRAFNDCPRRSPRALTRATLALLFGVFALTLSSALAGCESGPSTPLPDRVGAPSAPAPTEDAVVDRTITPPHRADSASELVRVGLLLPFSGPVASARAESAAMLNAAQLALFETDAQRLLIIPKDTGGTADGARRQTREALREGADVILGPLLAEEVRAASEEAALFGKTVIGFSNDRTLAELPNVYLLSVTPEEEVSRVVSYASSTGVVTFAALTPDSAYGLRVRDAAEAAARDNGSFLVTWEVFPAGGEAEPAARRISRYDQRLGARAAGQEDGFELPYDAIILPEGGVRLLSLAPLLPFFDVDPREVRFLGTGLWNDNAIAREPSLVGGWFAGPDQTAHDAFVQSYRRRFGAEPTRLAPLAYNGVLAISSLTRGQGANGLTAQALQRSAGFRGADGLFRFGADKLSQSALAVYEIRDGSFAVVEPAPQTFEPVAF